MSGSRPCDGSLLTALSSSNKKGLDMANDTRPTNNRAAERNRCFSCGFRMRGKNHKNGQHCISGSKGRFKPRKG